MAHLFIDEALTASEVGAIVSIGGAEAKHAVAVSRARVGETLSIGNGAGLIVSGPVVVAEPGRLSIEVAELVRTPRSAPQIVLVQALAKGGRDESAVQAATELGVDEVVPWAAARSVVRWEGPKIAKGVERWRAIVREATKQSLRAWQPRVADPETSDALRKRAAHGRMLLLEPSAEVRLSELVADDRDIVLVVGPEGGIAPEELAKLTAAGATAVRLGDSVLRTSTAGPAAIAVLSARMGRW